LTADIIGPTAGQMQTAYIVPPPPPARPGHCLGLPDTNDDIIAAIHGPHVPGAPAPWAVSFPGHPKDVPGACWTGAQWNGTTIRDESLNHYMTLGVYRPDSTGRSAANCVGVTGFMLDDLDTKAPPPEELEKQIDLSMLIETSPDNYQGVLLLDQPLTDLGLADRIQRAMIAKGLCDKGAHSPATRLIRLPYATNGKNGLPRSVNVERPL